MTHTTPTEIAAIHAAQVALSAPLSIKETVLAQILEAEPGVIALAKRYESVVYDTATSKGMREAIAARADLRDNGRMFLTKTEKRIKSDVNDLKRVMAPEFERLVAIIAPVEDAIDQQIKAEENRRAEEKAERERMEEKRVMAHTDNLARLSAYANQAIGQPVEAIERAIASLQSMGFNSDEWEEFAGQAGQIRDAAVESMQRTAAAERQRIENMRLAAELAAVQAQIAAIKAEAEAKARAEAEAAQAAERVAAQAQADAQADAERKRAESEANEKAATPAEAPAPAPAPVAPAPAAKVQPEPEPEPETEAAALTLASINAYLSPVVLDAQGMARMGIAATAGLYHAGDIPALRIALINHISNLQNFKA